MQSIFDKRYTQLTSTTQLAAMVEVRSLVITPTTQLAAMVEARRREGAIFMTLTLTPYS